MSRKRKKNKIAEITEKSLILTEEEISIIKSYTEKVSNYPCVECVYILPLYSYLNKKAEACIVTLYSDDPSYNKLLIGTESHRCDAGEIEEEEDIDNITLEFNNNSGNRLCFFTVPAEYYKYPPNNFEERAAVLKLYHSTILFDRFGNKSKIYNEIMSSFTIPNWLVNSCNYYISIDNIEHLVNNLSHPLSLKKKIRK